MGHAVHPQKLVPHIEPRPHLEPVVGPGAELEVADLVVEREEGQVEFARGAEVGDRGPEDHPVTAHHRQALRVHLVSVVVHPANERGRGQARGPRGRW